MDECLTPANNCKHICKNTIGSFTCMCPEGYTKTPFTDDCLDINECATNSGLCQNGYCVNLRGGYRCDCLDGFKPSEDNKKCVDQRQGFCFKKLIGGRCAVPNNELMKVSRQDCCCTMGEAWGPHCELCPERNTEAYTEMCHGSGLTNEGNGKFKTLR